MRLYKACVVLAIMVAFFSCNSDRAENGPGGYSSDTVSATTDKVAHDDRWQSLKLSITDTIKKTISHFFSNPQSEDIFLLTIEPGMVRNSKAKLEIIKADGKIIYTQSFDAFYLIRGIFEPDSTPTGMGQDIYEKYMDSYLKSITPKQYDEYFKRSIDSFFTNIYPIEQNKHENLKAWEDDISDKGFLNEVLMDSTIKLIDVTCFHCDEGGFVIGYSKRQNKVVTLVEHD